jgi:arginine decarboxylase
MFKPEPNELSADPYLQVVRREADHKLWDLLGFNSGNELELNGTGLSFIEAVRRYGSPLEVRDTTIVERRCQEWRKLGREAAERVGYDPEKLEYAYATKARERAEVVMAAYRSGFALETSGSQNLEDIKWLAQKGLINLKGLRLIHNGFKPEPHTESEALEDDWHYRRGRIDFAEVEHQVEATADVPYADYINLLRALGADSIVVLDSGELNEFAQPEVPAMQVGIRLKWGKFSTDTEAVTYSNRFGMTWEEAERTAETLAGIEHLELTMLHTMVSAAEEMPIDKFVDSLMLAADKYFCLKQKYPQMRYLNIGGGVPPLSEDYDHRLFLDRLLGGVKSKADSLGLEPPTLVFENGSLVAADSSYHVFEIRQWKSNSVDVSGNRVLWAILNGSIMVTLPDTIVLGKQFDFLAANNANLPAVRALLGGATCDGDDHYPRDMSKRVLLPYSRAGQFVVACKIGAYQKQISGERGGHHSAQKEPAELVLAEASDGRIKTRLIPRQTRDDIRKIYGYNEQMLPLLQDLKTSARHV